MGTTRTSLGIQPLHHGSPPDVGQHSRPPQTTSVLPDDLSEYRDTDLFYPPEGQPDPTRTLSLRTRSSSTKSVRTSPAGRWPPTTRHSRPPVRRRRRRRGDHSRDSDDERDNTETISPSIHDSNFRIRIQRHSAAVGPMIQTPPGCQTHHEQMPCGTASTPDGSPPPTSATDSTRRSAQAYWGTRPDSSMPTSIVSRLGITQPRSDSRHDDEWPHSHDDRIAASNRIPERGHPTSWIHSEENPSAF